MLIQYAAEFSKKSDLEWLIFCYKGLLVKKIPLQVSTDVIRVNLT